VKVYDLWGRYKLERKYVCISSSSNRRNDGQLNYWFGYSYNVWKGLNVEPNYSMGLKEDENGEREGTFNLGLSYKF
jgi:hypothetical protein